MATVLTNAKIYLGERTIAKGFVRFERQVQTVGPMAELQYKADDDVHDMTGKIIVPGFIDVHSHGGYGHDTMDADASGLKEMVAKMLGEGITSYFPTTITQAPAKIEAALATVAQVAQTMPQIAGIHMEGPFIAPEYMGAQPPEYIKQPDCAQLERYFAAGKGLVKIVSMAPELPAARQLERCCLAHGVKPSIGHTAAYASDVAASLATHVTHLYNAQRDMHHREPGVAGAALLRPNITAEIICDGFHVAPAMLKLAYKLKGARRLELITDSMRAKGLPEGKSELGEQPVWVKDGQARLADGHLAGSVLHYDTAFKNVIKFTGCSVEEAVWMSSVNAAQEFGLKNKGSLEVGADADLNVLDEQLNLQATYSYGKLVTATK